MLLVQCIYKFVKFRTLIRMCNTGHKTNIQMVLKVHFKNHRNINMQNRTLWINEYMKSTKGEIIILIYTKKSIVSIDKLLVVTFIVTFLVKYFSFVSGSDDNVFTISHMCSCHLQTKMSLMCSGLLQTN